MAVIRITLDVKPDTEDQSGVSIKLDALHDAGILTDERTSFEAFLRGIFEMAIDGLRDSLDLAKKLVTRHGVAVAPGVAFGSAGEGWLRVCFAQSPELMERAMKRLRDGIRVEMAA